MAKQFFEVEKGLLFEGITILPTSGAPNAGDFDTAGVGSVAFDTTVGHIYRKITTGSGADKWERLATSTDIANIASSVDWRDSVSVADLVATTLPTGTATQTITVDGITIDDTQRVLFGALTTSPNVYLYNKATGLFVEDSNAETPGDTVYVEQGTSAGATLTFNYAGAWVLTGDGSLNEEGYIRAYVGKPTTGSVLPQYSSNNYVADNDTLVVGVGKLDLALGNVRTKTTGTNITTTTIVDTVNVDTWDAASWFIKVKGNADNALKQYVVVSAIHDGKASADATTVDFTVFSKLRLGVIDGLTYSVVLSSGTGASQAMELKITSTTAVDVEAFRTIL